MKYYASNASYREATRIYNRIYRATHQDAIKALKRAYYDANVEAIRQSARDYYAANAETRRKASRAYYVANTELCRNASRAYRIANPDVVRAHNQRRRARKQGNGGKFTHQELSTMRIVQAGVCAYCQYQYDLLTIDHIIPLRQGGPHQATNICLACRRCNSSKGNRTPDQWVNRWYNSEKD